MEREIIKKNIASQRRSSKVSMDMRIGSGLSRPMDALKANDQNRNQSNSSVNDQQSRRLSIISNISNIDLNDDKLKTNKWTIFAITSMYGISTDRSIDC